MPNETYRDEATKDYGHSPLTLLSLTVQTSTYLPHLVVETSISH